MGKISKTSMILLTLIMSVTFVPAVFAAPPQNAAAFHHVDHTTYGWALQNAAKNDDGTVTITIMEVPNFEEKTYTTAVSLDSADYASSVTGVTRADALSDLLRKNAFVEVMFNKWGECIDLELIEYNTASYMDSASYGGELTAKNGKAGNMVAQGWVLNKNKGKNTITIGDGNHYTNIFDQTYTLADDVKIYVVDSPTTRSASSYNPDGTWGLVKQGSFDDIKVTAKTNGEIYYTPERYVALCIFDSNYKKSWKDGMAKVKELYLFDDPTTMGASDMYEPDGMQYSGTSWYPLKSRAVEETWHGYAGSAMPIEFMKDRLYAIGDIYTSVMLFVGDDGTLTCLDMGNSTSNYQYYLNIAKLGYNPRDVDNIFLTHGHGDHYGAMYEFSTMIRRGGNKNFKGWINSYSQNGDTFISETGNTYTMGGTLRDNPVLYSCNALLEWEKWTDFLGTGTSTYIWRGMGHTTDTAAFFFKLQAKHGDAYFNKGDTVGFLYFGGYALRQQASVGAMRLALVNSLQYWQSVVVPWATAQSDYIYPLTQHTNQISMLEIDKASKIAGVPFMAGYVGGPEELSNYAENRIANQMYQSYNDAYEDDYSDNLSQILREAGLPVPDAIDWDLMPAAASDKVYVEGTRGTKRFDTIEEHGPFKRPEDCYNISVKNVVVVHGYDAFMNKQPLFKDQTNVYGFTLDQGFVILWDTYTHDPDGWFVQVMADVNDEYDGGVDYATNWCTESPTCIYTTNYDNKGERPTEWESGPVELTNPLQGSNEFLRLPRFDTREEAEAYAKALTNGAYAEPYQVYSVAGGITHVYGDTKDYDPNDFGTALTGAVTYNVCLDRMSQIILGDSFEETFLQVQP